MGCLLDVDIYMYKYVIFTSTIANTYIYTQYLPVCNEFYYLQNNYNKYTKK